MTGTKQVSLLDRHLRVRNILRINRKDNPIYLGCVSHYNIKVKEYQIVCSHNHIIIQVQLMRW